MSQADRTGYGETGVPSHPYHNEFGADTYYPAPCGDDELRRRFHEAQRGLSDLHAFLAQRAVNGDLNAMRAFDEICRTLGNYGYVGFPVARNLPWNKSSFNRQVA